MRTRWWTKDKCHGRWIGASRASVFEGALPARSHTAIPTKSLPSGEDFLLRDCVQKTVIAIESK